MLHLFRYFKKQKQQTVSVSLRNSNSFRFGELEQSVVKAQAELDSLREQRTQQLKITESIVRQRDMYRVLLAQATGVNFPQQGNTQE